MPILQPIVNIAELLARRSITHVVVSPGSRSAPLTLAVARHPDLTVRVMADERAAGFVALGMAQQRQQPVVLICTSGSAVYNLAPAVAEAYFQQVPLILLTADRPHEWLYQQDGQTMDQVNVFGTHVKRSYDLPADYTHPDARWAIERQINEAITLSQLAPSGPVHINVPLREPFYPGNGEVFEYGPVRVIETLQAQPSLAPETWHELLREWEQSERPLILAGQMPRDPTILQTLQQLSEEFGVPVVGEIISNLPGNGAFITHTDTALSGLSEAVAQSLQPDLLITIGNSLLSRNLKAFFRSHSGATKQGGMTPHRHWHIQPNPDRINDSLQSLTTLIPAEPLPFLQKLFADLDYQRFREGDEDDADHDFLTRWQTTDRQAAKLVDQTLNQEPELLTDWSAVRLIVDSLPKESVLHLANSMPVRYANLCGVDERLQISVSANRGVSGIDGCLSSALGAALMTDRLVTLLIGDVAFFYDRNALWSAPIPANLRIVLLNNDGGHIFRIIDGPGRQPELETYFETPHGYTARNTAQDARIDYTVCRSLPELRSLLSDFFSPGDQAKLLEITTDKVRNQQQFESYRERIRQKNP